MSVSPFVTESVGDGSWLLMPSTLTGTPSGSARKYPMVRLYSTVRGAVGTAAWNTLALALQASMPNMHAIEDKERR